MRQEKQPCTFQERNKTNNSILVNRARLSMEKAQGKTKNDFSPNFPKPSKRVQLQKLQK